MSSTPTIKTSTTDRWYKTIVEIDELHGPAVEEMYLAQVTIDKIAAEFNITRVAVEKVAKLRKLKRVRPIGKRPAEPRTLMILAKYGHTIEQLYLDNVPLRQIAAKYDISAWLIHKILKLRDVQARGRLPQTASAIQTAAEHGAAIKELYATPLSLPEIAAKIGITRTKLRAALRYMAVPPRAVKQRRKSRRVDNIPTPSWATKYFGADLRVAKLLRYSADFIIWITTASDVIVEMKTTLNIVSLSHAVYQLMLGKAKLLADGKIDDTVRLVIMYSHIKLDNKGRAEIQQYNFDDLKQFLSIEAIQIDDSVTTAQPTV